MNSRLQESPSVDVFVSYAREDLPFVRSLTEALRSRGRTVWVDLEGLYAGEDWWPSLCRAIDAANTLVFVLSPHSATSLPCQAELDHASTHGKRIIPLAWSDPGHAELPAVLKDTHWLIRQPDVDFDTTVQALLAALDSDPVWMRGHTRWLQFALDWDRGGRLDRLLLGGAYLDEARRWLETDAPCRNPLVVPVQRELIAASERVELLNQARSDLTKSRCAQALTVLLRVAEQGTPALGVAGHAMLFEGLRRLRSCEPLDVTEHSVESLALDRCGRRVVAGDLARASLWDLGTRPARRLETVDAMDLQLPLISPDGDRLLVGVPGGLGLFDAAAGMVMSRVELDHKSELCACFSPDGHCFAVCDGARVRVFSAEDGRLIQERDHGSTVGIGSVSFNPRDSSLLSVSPERACLWQPETFELQWAANSGTRSTFWTARFSADGTWVVAARGNSRLTVWRTSDGAVAATLAGAKGNEFKDACFADEDRCVVAFGSLEMRSWKWPDAKGRGREVPSGTNLALSPRGGYVAISSGDRSGRIVLRDVYTGELKATLGRHTESVKALSWTADGEYLVSGDEKGLLVFWAMSTHSVHGTAQADGGAVYHLHTMPDGRGVVAACDGLRVWRFDASLAVRRVEGPLRSICVLPHASLSVAIHVGDDPATLRDGDADAISGPFMSGTSLRHCRASPDGRWLASIGQDDVLTLIDVASMSAVCTWPAGGAFRLAFDAGGSRLLASSSEACTVWDVAQRVALLMCGGDLVTAHASALSPDGRRVCVAETRWEGTARIRSEAGHGARIIDLDSGQTVNRIEWGDDPRWHRYSDVSFSPDGSTILLRRNDGQAGIMDATNGSLVRAFGDEESRHSFAAWSPDGRAIVTSDSEGVAVWNPSDGVRIARFDEQADAREIVFSHDGALAATVGSHGVWVWDRATWTPLANLCDGIDRFPQTAAFSANSLGLIIIEGDGQSAWYPVGRDALVEAARPWARG